MAQKKLNVYLIHTPQLNERRKVIDELKKTLGKYSFSKLKVNDIITILEDDPAAITSERVASLVNYSPVQSTEEEIKIYNSLLRVLHINNISNALKHYAAMKRISECVDSDIIHLVLEDDAMFEPRMCMMLDKAIDKIADEDIVFLGMPNNEPVTNTNTVTIKECKQVFKILPYCDSYAIKPATAKILVDAYYPIKFLTNIHIDFLMKSNKIVAKQTVPNLFVDGSKFGMFLSSQVVNNDLIFNKEYMFLKGLLNKPVTDVTEDEKNTVEKIAKESNISNNPDFMCLLGKYTREIKKDYKEAMNIYQKTFDIYQKNGGLINNESLFLRDFISLHSLVQEDIA